LIRTPFLDLERVEVLRGPQGIIFGKNTIAGALNLTTAKPTDETMIDIRALYEFESEQEELTAVLSGPLSDNVRARLALRSYEETGYVDNTFKNTEEPQRDEAAVRFTLDWDISADLNASLKVEQNNFETNGRQIEIVRDLPNLFPAGATPIAGLNYAQVLGAFGQPPLESNLDYRRQANSPEFSNSEMSNITVNVDYQLGENTLTFVTGHLEYEFDEIGDFDYVPASVFYGELEEDFEQFSQEIRLASPTGGNVEWMTGAYYQTTEMDSIERIVLPPDSLFNILAATSTDPSVQALAVLPGTNATRLNNQDSDAWAFFAQGTWNIAADWRLTVGGRYTQEDKDATRNMNLLSNATSAPITNPMVALVYFGAFDIYTEQTAGLQVAPGVFLPGHNVTGSRSESMFTPVVSLQWDATPNNMLYASYTTGFKAGGFDARANNPFSFEFEDEEVTAFEFGAKNTLADGALELNAALFFTDYEDLQIAQFDGTLGFNVGNARETELWGLEIDGRWAITDSLVMNYAYAWLDYEYTDFRNGNCYERQVPDGDVVNGIPLCDYTGMSGRYTPENNFSVSFDYTRALNNGISILANLNFNYVDEQNVHENHDPAFMIDSYTRINARLGLMTDNWSLMLIGKNLSDEDVLTYVGNTPLAGSTFGTNTYYGFVDRPRQVAVELGYRF
jgi:outer membrane receptor protein involved in Fe transport